MGADSDYLYYLSESLGVENLILPLGGEASGPALSFCVQKGPSWTSEAEEMLHKMIKAMGLSASQFQILDQAPQEPTTLTVIFEEQLNESEAGQWLQNAQGEELRTWSPTVLLKSPELKKAVWSHLQSVMARVSS